MFAKFVNHSVAHQNVASLIIPMVLNLLEDLYGPHHWTLVPRGIGTQLRDPICKKRTKAFPKKTPKILHQMFDCTVAALWSCVNDQILESLRCHPFGHALTLTWLLCGFLRQIGGFPHCVYF
jgi:hypothetical protein